MIKSQRDGDSYENGRRQEDEEDPDPGREYLGEEEPEEISDLEGHVDEERPEDAPESGLLWDGLNGRGDFELCQTGMRG